MAKKKTSETDPPTVDAVEAGSTEGIEISFSTPKSTANVFEMANEEVFFDDLPVGLAARLCSEIDSVLVGETTVENLLPRLQQITRKWS